MERTEDTGHSLALHGEEIIGDGVDVLDDVGIQCR